MDTSFIQQLLNRFENALVIYVQSTLSGADLINRMIELGETQEDAERRARRNNSDLIIYYNIIQRFHSKVRVVFNDFNEEDTGIMYRQIREIYNEEIVNSNVIPERSIFLIQSYNNTEKAQANFEMIKDAADHAFGDVDDERVFQAINRQDGSYMISDHVWDSIDSRDCIICDVTNDRCDNCQETCGDGTKKNQRQGTSANVWLELGYAIAVLRQRHIDPAKRLIVICDENHRSTPPVDLGGSALKIITYDSSKQMSLRNKIEEQLKNMFQ